LGHKVTMLGTGLIGLFYTQTLHGKRGRDRVDLVSSRRAERAEAVARDNGVARTTTDLEEAIGDPETDTVLVGVPNHLHEEAIELCARHGKAVLCTKPLARNAEEAKRILDTVERAGVFAGYLEDLVYTPKTLKAVAAVRAGQIGDVTWARSRETHPGPHSAWFWDAEQAGGGAIVDLGCHCIEIIRSFMGKDNRPVEVSCWTDTMVHPIEAEDNAIALIRFESGAIGQFEVSWTFRGGMDLRDEVAGTEGTIWTNHFLRTGFEMFSSGEGGDYVAEKAETASGWLFPVGDEVAELGYVDMFADMFDAMDEGREPRETFYDGYVVNAVVDACYRSAASRRWEPVQLEWRGGRTEPIARERREWDGKTIIKQEKMPDGRLKLIVKDESTGEFSDVVTEGEPAVV
jgi:predicted dehydrogenase